MVNYISNYVKIVIKIKIIKRISKIWIHFFLDENVTVVIDSKLFNFFIIETSLYII